MLVRQPASPRAQPSGQHFRPQSPDSRQHGTLTSGSPEPSERRRPSRRRGESSKDDPWQRRARVLGHSLAGPHRRSSWHSSSDEADPAGLALPSGLAGFPDCLREGLASPLSASRPGDEKRGPRSRVCRALREGNEPLGLREVPRRSVQSGRGGPSSLDPEMPRWSGPRPAACMGFITWLASAWGSCLPAGRGASDLAREARGAGRERAEAGPAFSAPGRPAVIVLPVFSQTRLVHNPSCAPACGTDLAELQTQSCPLLSHPVQWCKKFV